MGWYINELLNEPTFTHEQAQDIAPKLVALNLDAFEIYHDDPTTEECVNAVFGQWWGKEERTEWKVYFNDDHMEHMDWLTHNADACQILADAGAHGRVCFGSEEGDNAVDKWGVEFASGQYRSITATVSWS